MLEGGKEGFMVKNIPPEGCEALVTPLTLLSSFIPAGEALTPSSYHILPYNVLKSVVMSSWLRINC